MMPFDLTDDVTVKKTKTAVFLKVIIFEGASVKRLKLYAFFFLECISILKIMSIKYLGYSGKIKENNP